MSKPSTSTIRKVRDYLQANQAGATRVEIAKALSISPRHLENVTAQLTRSNGIAWVKQGGIGNDHQTRLYFALQHAPAEAKAQKPPRVEPMMRKERYGQRASPGEARITSDTKVTIAPPFIDRRFACVGSVPSVIDSSQCRPWAMAA